MPQREKTQSTHRKWQKKAFSGKSTINNSNKHFNAINGIATVITIQLHFSTFWGTFCKICLFLLKKNGLNLPPFHKGPFLCSYITKKIFHLEPCNLVENCPIESSFRYRSHYLTNVTYAVFRIVNVRKGYPYPQNLEFLATCCRLNFT